MDFWNTVKYFKPEEFDCPGFPGSGKQFMNPAFILKLDLLREKVGFPLTISSGYRTPEYNDKISTTGRTGPHTTGKAADILVAGVQADRVLEEAYALKFTGKGISQNGAYGSRFIHLDIVEGATRPALWSY